MNLPKNTGINKHNIELVNMKQLLYSSIYAFNSVELDFEGLYQNLAKNWIYSIF